MIVHVTLVYAAGIYEKWHKHLPASFFILRFPKESVPTMKHGHGYDNIRTERQSKFSKTMTRVQHG